MLACERQQGVESAQGVPINPEELPCQGCDADYQSNCEFVTCNKRHGTESCAFCPEFPCAMLVKFKDDEWEHHQSVLDNLRRIKEIGIEAWVREQQKLWSCPDCGARAIWYQETCAQCGKALPHHY